MAIPLPKGSYSGQYDMLLNEGGKPRIWWTRWPVRVEGFKIKKHKNKIQFQRDNKTLTFYDISHYYFYPFFEISGYFSCFNEVEGKKPKKHKTYFYNRVEGCVTMQKGVIYRSVGRSIGWSVLDCTWNKHDFILRHFQI